MAKKIRPLTIRGHSFTGKPSESTVKLGKLFVEACQVDGMYPRFKDDNWTVQMKMNTSGLILLRPVDLAEAGAEVEDNESPSPVRQSWPEQEQLGQPLPSWGLGPEPDSGSMDGGHTVTISSDEEPLRTKPPVDVVGDDSSPLPTTPAEAKAWTPESKYLLKMSRR